MLSFPNWGRANYEPILCTDYVCADLEFMTVLMSVDTAIINTGELAKIILENPSPFVLHHHEILLSGFHQTRRRDLWFSHRIR